MFKKSNGLERRSGFALSGSVVAIASKAVSVMPMRTTGLM